MLDALGRHCEALPHRIQAARLEPAPWSYNGLAGTLEALGEVSAAQVARMHAQEQNPPPPSLPADTVFSLGARHRMYCKPSALEIRLMADHHTKSLSPDDEPAIQRYYTNHHLTRDQVWEIDGEAGEKRWDLGCS
jgi:hypothetical protein